MEYRITMGRRSYMARLVRIRMPALLLVFACLCLAPIAAQADAQTSEAAAHLELVVAPDAPPEGVRWGTEVRYEFKLSNIGGVAVSSIEVADTLCGDVGSVGTLAPGESIVLYGTAVITGTGSGEASAVGTDSGGASVRATAQHSVEVYIAHDWHDYAIAKSAALSSAEPGDVIDYTLVITNNNDSFADPAELEVVDTFDPSLAVVESASGATVANGRIVWRVSSFDAAAGPKVISYSLRVGDSATPGSTLGNVVSLGVLGGSGDIAPQDNVSSASVSIVAGSEDGGEGDDPFLPLSDESFDSAVNAAQARSATVQASDQEPFLPFTGAPAIAWMLALGFATAGSLLKAVARNL